MAVDRYTIVASAPTVAPATVAREVLFGAESSVELGTGVAEGNG